MRRWRRDEIGATAVESAMLFPVFAALCSMTIYLGYYYYCSSGLAYALQQGSRQIIIGNAQNNGVTTAQNFVRTYMCPALPPLMSCSNVIVNAEVVNIHLAPGFWGSQWSGLIERTPQMDNAQTQFCIGGGSALVGLQAYYALPTPGASQMFNGNPATFININAAFLNEPFVTNYQSC